MTTKEYEFKVLTPDNIVDIVALHYESLNTFLNSHNLMYWQNTKGVEFVMQIADSDVILS